MDSASDPVRFWADALGEWAIPEQILAQAPESPWFHDPAAFAADDAMATDTVSYTRAREALDPPGTVLDVGCGGGRSSLGLVPPATHVTGVDANQHMLDAFAAAARARGAGHTEVHGTWPESATRVGRHDVAVCHHVLYNVADLEPFIAALHAKAARRVVVELTTTHPTTMMNPAWKHFWDLDRPTRPNAGDALAAIRAVLGPGVAVGYAESPRAALAAAADDPARQAGFVRRRLCLPASRDPEVAAFLAAHPFDRSRTTATIWWDTAR